MKWVLTLESFVSQLPKTYFVQFSDNIGNLTREGSSKDYKAINMLVKALFDEIIILDEMTINEIDEWIETIKSDDIVFCYSVKVIGEWSNKKKKRVMNYVHNKINKKKGVQLRMNDSFVQSKSDFYELFKQYDFMPKTCFSKKKAIETLKFPIVAKPDGGSLGIGIQKFESKEELNSSKDTFDVFCEYVESLCEIRVFVLDGKIVCILERIHKFTDKNNIDSKSKDDRIKFVYVPQNMVGFPYLRKIQDIVKVIDKGLGSHMNSIYSIDILITPDQQLKVLESNSKSMLGLYEFMEICKNILDIPYQTTLLMEKIANLYINEQYEQYKTQIKKSLHPINYKTTPIDDELLKALKGFDEDSF